MDTKNSASKQKKMDQAYQKLEIEHGRVGTDEEVAQEIGISTEELTNWQNQTKVTNLISLDEFLEQGAEVRVDSDCSLQFEQPERVMEKEEMKETLIKTLEMLTENEKKVITLYYYEDLTLKEISHILEVSESRVSQLHTKALQKMRQRLGNSMEMFW